MIRCVFNDQLFLGNAHDARDLKLLYENGIAAVVDLAINEPPAQLAREMIYCRFPLTDGSGNSSALLELAIHTTVMLLEQKLKTLVACSAGMSRSPCIAAAAISLLTGVPLQECLIGVVSNSPHDVSPLFLSQVIEITRKFDNSNDGQR